MSGQVGRHDSAPAILKAMASSLTGEGIIIITGFTQSRLEPKLLDACRLEVVEASVPSPEAGGLESGFSRFHFFVLRKRGAGSGHEEPEASIRNNLRKLMLS